MVQVELRATKAEQAELKTNRGEQVISTAKQMTTTGEQTGTKIPMVEQTTTTAEQTGSKTPTAELMV